jgi:hypothetical protein
MLVSSLLEAEPPWGDESRFELVPTLKQADTDTQPSELHRTLTELRSTLILAQPHAN